MTHKTVHYKDTINLPKTAFPMKADLPQREPEIRRRWRQENIYAQIRRARQGRPKYVLHDGPPYANGEIHMGTALNKVLKDVVVKYKTMRGFDSPFIPGWDCHGLPIEHKVMQELAAQAAETPKVEIRRRCHDYAMKYVGVQSEQFQMLGVFGQFDEPYLTLHPSYEAGIIDVFAKLVEGGYVYRQLKSVHWCIECETALAEAELEYADELSPSIYVNFEMDKAAKAKFPAAADGPLQMMIWTTTPWTLPANVAIAVHPQFEYTAVRYRDPKGGRPVTTVLATERIEAVLAAAKVTQHERLAAVRGKELEGLTYRHVFMDRVGKLVLADYVTLSDGTGCVHTAPGHGAEDYRTGVEYGLPITSPVDARGRFTAEAGEFQGQDVFEANSRIVRRLDELGVLVAEQRLTHSYPHCWRCKQPVIFRATEQWFINIDHANLRGRVLDEIARVNWVPSWGQTRIRSMVQERPDWCISRQRAWGVPIPGFYCERCGELAFSAQLARHVRDLFAREGADAWFTKDADELVPPGTKCAKCGSMELRKESDILDVWFESGASHRSVCQEYKELKYPADLYLEGSDQHRGWFQSSILAAVGATGRAPFLAVLTHGFIVDEQGEKMSKSLGNVVDAVEAVEKLGADILRLFMCSVDYTNDVKVSKHIIERLAEAYRKIRNTLRYLLGNLYDFLPARDPVRPEEMPEIDRWALASTARLVEAVTEAYDRFEFYRVYQLVYTFCVVEMSGFYLDVLKDRLYCEAAAGRLRRSAQTVLYHVLGALVRILAPILPHTAEEVWALVPAENNKPKSVHLALWPEPLSGAEDGQLGERWQRLEEVRVEVLRELEKLRAAGTIGSALEATVTLSTDHEPLRALLEEYRDELCTLFIVSEARLANETPAGAVQGLELPTLWVKAQRSTYSKCQRCWNYKPEVGSDAEHPTLCGRCAAAVRQTAGLEAAK